jgi:hypothetical protein
MRQFPATITEHEMRLHLREWVELLSQGRLHEAVEWLSPEIPDSSGSTSKTVWTAELLEAVIANYGLDEPVEGDDWRYSVTPLTDELEATFHKCMRVDFDMWERLGADGLRLAGAAHVDLPLVYKDGPGMSDLTARFMLKHLQNGQRALVLLDIHVL